MRASRRRPVPHRFKGDAGYGLLRMWVGVWMMEASRRHLVPHRFKGDAGYGLLAGDRERGFYPRYACWVAGRAVADGARAYPPL
jgi:hypothetical protein